MIRLRLRRSGAGPASNPVSYRLEAVASGPTPTGTNSVPVYDWDEQDETSERGV
jgi:hypothetical protein